MSFLHVYIISLCRQSIKTPIFKSMKRNILLTLCFALIVSLVTQKCIAGSARKVSGERQEMIDLAISLRGTPYKYAGKTPKTGFDCSGFVSYVANFGAGVRLPSNSKGMYKAVEIIKEKDKEPGDLMFFKTTGSGAISHVGIYLGLYQGEGQFKNKKIFIHAASDGPETGVIISSIDDPYWASHFADWGRILPKTQ